MSPPETARVSEERLAALEAALADAYAASAICCCRCCFKVRLYVEAPPVPPPAAPAPSAPATAGAEPNDKAGGADGSATRKDAGAPSSEGIHEGSPSPPAPSAQAVELGVAPAGLLSDADLEATYAKGGPSHCTLLMDRRARIFIIERLTRELAEARAASPPPAPQVAAEALYVHAMPLNLAPRWDRYGVKALMFGEGERVVGVSLLAHMVEEVERERDAARDKAEAVWGEFYAATLKAGRGLNETPLECIARLTRERDEARAERNEARGLVRLHEEARERAMAQAAAPRSAEWLAAAEAGLAMVRFDLEKYPNDGDFCKPSISEAARLLHEARKAVRALSAAAPPTRGEGAAKALVDARDRLIKALVGGFSANIVSALDAYLDARAPEPPHAG